MSEIKAAPAGCPMHDVLTADDPLYEELYDVRREAMAMGNFVEIDTNAAMSAARSKGAVQKGYLREILDLPVIHRHQLAIGRDGYTTFSWDACEKAFRNARSFSARILHHPQDGEEKGRSILEMDGVEHRAHRKTMQPLFKRTQTSTWWRERWLGDIVDTLIQRIAQKDRAELNIEYCARIPVHTITRAIGLSGDDSLVFREAFVKSGLGGNVTPEQRKAANLTVERMLLDLVAMRREERRDDLISSLLDAELRMPGDVRPLTDREIMIHARIVMIAGGGTTWRQLGITLWALLTHPEQLEAAKADRTLIDKAIEESLRWNATAPVFNRLVIEDIEMEGILIPEGSVVDICLGAANRDPDRFERPDDYDLFRPHRGHLGFGNGEHQCLGQDVARSEMSEGILSLLDAFPNLRLDPEAPAPFLTGGLEQRGMSALPVLLR
ncbi:MAG TPA: cytochrome P450 [Sphingobium sp.]|uniref:cytochrome P450 n=1 Tax=Sphingobium sp. TaxID=1912891 RepID=UPI002ED677CD